MAEIHIRQATIQDLDLLVPLFDAYRRFYRQPGDADGAKAFLGDRFQHHQSVIFLALDGARCIGFTQLYPSFSSVSMARIFILNDLYVDTSARGRKVASALLRASAAYGKAVRAVRLVLSTELTNTTAQKVYESQGWVRETRFLSYELSL